MFVFEESDKACNGVLRTKITTKFDVRELEGQKKFLIWMFEFG